MPKDKSVGAALVLTFLFGPFGLLYASVAGGLLMLAVAFVAGVLTLGIGLLLVWPVTMVWGAIAASNKHSQYQAWLAQQSRQPWPPAVPPPSGRPPLPPPPRTPPSMNP